MRGLSELIDDIPTSLLSSLLEECLRIGLYYDILLSFYNVTILYFSFLFPLLLLLLPCLYLYWVPEWLLLALFGQSNYFLIFSILENNVSIEDDKLVYKWDYIIVPIGNLFYLLGVFKGDDIVKLNAGFATECSAIK